jgi:hypothetical protein
VLPDGRVLFASTIVTLPLRPSSQHQAAQFFLLDPAKRSATPVRVPITEGSLPEDLSSIALSPDGRFMAVADAASDVVSVLELATGKVKVISPAHAGWKTRLIPAWRGTLGLTFAGLPSPEAVRPELILWQPDAPQRILSADWPESIVKPWLEAPP